MTEALNQPWCLLSLPERQAGSLLHSTLPATTELVRFPNIICMQTRFGLGRNHFLVASRETNLGKSCRASFFCNLKNNYGF
jgi:hypothetical protein